MFCKKKKKIFPILFCYRFFELKFEIIYLKTQKTRSFSNTSSTVTIQSCSRKETCQPSYKKVNTVSETVSCCSNSDNCNVGLATYTGLKCYRGGGTFITGGSYTTPYEYGLANAYCWVNIK
jgi:hypothetical protein